MNQYEILSVATVLHYGEARRLDRYSGVPGVLENRLESMRSFSQNNPMKTVLDMGRLTRTEKVRAMEELWEDLSREDDVYPSPEWHGEVLQAREEALNAGRDKFVPWEEAKRILREKSK